LNPGITRVRALRPPRRHEEHEEHEGRRRRRRRFATPPNRAARLVVRNPIFFVRLRVLRVFVVVVISAPA